MRKLHIPLTINIWNLEHQPRKHASGIDLVQCSGKLISGCGHAGQNIAKSPGMEYHTTSCPNPAPFLSVRSIWDTFKSSWYWSLIKGLQWANAWWSWDTHWDGIWKGIIRQLTQFLKEAFGRYLASRAPIADPDAPIIDCDPKMTHRLPWVTGIPFMSA